MPRINQTCYETYRDVPKIKQACSATYKDMSRVTQLQINGIPTPQAIQSEAINIFLLRRGLISKLRMLSREKERG